MGKVFSGIVRAITSVVKSVFNVIKSVVKTVFNVIKSVISGIVNFFFNSQIGAFLGIAFLFLPQNALWSIGKFLFHIERFLPIPVTTRLGLQLKTLALFSKLQGWQSAIWFKIGALTSSFYKIYKLHEIKLRLYLWDISQRINEALGFNLGQLIGKIYNKLKEGAEVLEKIVILSQIQEAIRKKRFLQAFYLTVDYVDEKYSKKINEAIVYVKSLIDSVNREIAKIVNFTNTILYDLQTKAYYFERAFKEIGEAFGVELFEDIGKAIHKYIVKNIRDVRKETYEQLTNLRKFILDKTNWIYQTWLFVRNWQNFKREEKALLSIWHFNPFLKAKNAIPLYFYIPRPIGVRLGYV